MQPTLVLACKTLVFCIIRFQAKTEAPFETGAVFAKGNSFAAFDVACSWQAVLSDPRYSENFTMTVPGLVEPHSRRGSNDLLAKVGTRRMFADFAWEPLEAICVNNDSLARSKPEHYRPVVHRSPLRSTSRREKTSCPDRVCEHPVSGRSPRFLASPWSRSARSSVAIALTRGNHRFKVLADL